MDYQHLNRLKEEQTKAIDDTNANILQWEKFRSDYKSLKTRLKTLPDKVTHDVMVPFGPLAFMPGKLVHTNEILVLLGDNWFAERSAKQACEIIDRRMKAINTEIEKLEKQKKLLQPRFDAVNEQLSQQPGTFEITEPYDEEKEKHWKEQHRKNVKAYKKRLHENKDKPAEKKKAMTDEELWERLDQLEQIESERQEMTRLTGGEILLNKSYDSDDSIMSIDSGSNSDTNDPNNQESSSEGVTGDEGSDTNTQTKTIKFRHTVSKRHSSGTVSSDSDVESSTIAIRSPADIYNLLPKSILKHDSAGGMAKDDVKFKSQQALKQPVAFSGSVVERSPVSKPDSTGDYSSTNTDQRGDKPVRMSKFKARRQGLDQT